MQIWCRGVQCEDAADLPPLYEAHEAQPVAADVLVGCAALDLSALHMLGLLDGWYNVVDYHQQLRGQLKVCAVPAYLSMAQSCVEFCHTYTQGGLGCILHCEIVQVAWVFVGSHDVCGGCYYWFVLHFSVLGIFCSCIKVCVATITQQHGTLTALSTDMIVHCLHQSMCNNPVVCLQVMITPLEHLGSPVRPRSQPAPVQGIDIPVQHVTQDASHNMAGIIIQGSALLDTTGFQQSPSKLWDAQYHAVEEGNDALLQLLRTSIQVS